MTKASKGPCATVTPSDNRKTQINASKSVCKPKNKPMTKSARRLRLKTRPALGVVILGAGASSRMGRPKLLLPWGGASVIGHLLRQWKRLGARQIAVVCRTDDKPLMDELDRLGFPARDRIANLAPQHGMFSSIVCAANWVGWDPALTVWAIVLGDQPHLRLESLRALLAFQRKHPENICQPSYGGHRRHPVLLPREAWVELRKSRARTLKVFLRKTTVPAAECPIDDICLTLDMDTRQDYSRLLRIQAAKRDA
jgi:molybdenum cofactor cytidylyltransferase